ncbi:[NiFe]-hydrogenase assembly chaperone HybE, partial [Salmonella enterica subsp. enterica serovar Anatum]|nr:[NiFe]-hydrogenase assembly chaperone HybE [Salmonella enterica subsp. enterica serovar Anatum]
ETDDTGERTFYYWRNEAAAKFWLESEQSAAICEALATFDYLYAHRSMHDLSFLHPTMPVHVSDFTLFEGQWTGTVITPWMLSAL